MRWRAKKETNEMNMKQIIKCAALTAALVMGTALEGKSNSSKLSPEEVKARREMNILKNFGGIIVDRSMQSGRCVLVNVQKKVPVSYFDEIIRKFHNRLRCDLVVIESDKRPEISDAATELKRIKAEAAIFIVDDKSLPTLLVAPESNWAFMNVSPLLVDSPDEEKLRIRAMKELSRSMGYLLGAANSADVRCVMQPVNTLKDLDKLIAHELCYEPEAAMKEHLKAIGITPFMKYTYLQGCRKGWAKPPTNEYQKAIWDKVHAAPKNPMKIEFDPKKGR